MYIGNYKKSRYYRERKLRFRRLVSKAGVFLSFAVILSLLFYVNLRIHAIATVESSRGETVLDYANSSPVSVEGTPESFDYDKSSEPEIEIKPLFVGDSRTAGMAQSVDNINVIALEGSGLDYLGSIDSSIRATDADCIVMGLGINDVHNIEYYIDYANELALDMDIPVFYLTLYPVDDKKCEEYGRDIRNENIWEFNSRLTENAEGYMIIDTNDYVSSYGFISDDGLHYSAETYSDIYSFIMDEIKDYMKD